MRDVLNSMRRRVGELAFERRYGVDTAGRTSLDDLGLDGPERVYYSPANWLSLRRALPRRSVRGDDVFLDLGSGKGRVVLQAASAYRFGRVVGVELAPQLHEAARVNVSTVRTRLRSGRIELVNSDVLAYEVPDDVTVVFMNNPFRGATFRAAVAGLIASAERRPRRMRLVYYNPVEEPVLLATGRFVRVRRVASSPLRRSRGPFGTICVYELVPGDAHRRA